MNNGAVVEINFVGPPSRGTLYVRDGQHYEVLGVDPYWNKHGRSTYVITWGSRCAECGKPFQTTTGVRAKSINRRCDKHKARGKPVSRARRCLQAKRVAKKSRKRIHR